MLNTWTYWWLWCGLPTTSLDITLERTITRVLWTFQPPLCAAVAELRSSAPRLRFRLDLGASDVLVERIETSPLISKVALWTTAKIDSHMLLRHFWKCIDMNTYRTQISQRLSVQSTVPLEVQGNGRHDEHRGIFLFGDL